MEDINIIYDFNTLDDKTFHFKNVFSSLNYPVGFQTKSPFNSVEQLINYILPERAYTKINLILCLFGLLNDKTELSSICYSNSLSILTAFQSTSIIAPEAYHNFVKLYKSSLRFWVLNILSHYVPPIIFYKKIKPIDITLKTVSMSAGLNLLWANCVKWDLNKVYNIDPPLNQMKTRILWFIILITHYLIYFVPRKIYPLILPTLLPLGKRSLFSALLR